MDVFKHKYNRVIACFERGPRREKGYAYAAQLLGKNRTRISTAPGTVVEAIRDALPPIVGFVHFQQISDGAQEIYLEIEDTPDEDELDNFARHKRICDHLTRAIHRVHPGVIRDMRVIVLGYDQWYVDGFSGVNDRNGPMDWATDVAPSG